MAIVALFYLSTNFVVYALVDHRDLATNNAPLIAVGTVLFGSLGAGVVALGAMISVSGSDESDMLGSSRLAYAMAADGLLPHSLASLNARFGTPHVALIGQGIVAAALTFVDRIPQLIAFAVFNLAFAFLLCALALLRLHRIESVPVNRWRRVLPLLAIAISLGLLASTATADKITGVGLLLLGTVLYVAVAPRATLPHALAEVTETDRVLRRLATSRMRFLGGLVASLGGQRSQL